MAALEELVGACAAGFAERFGRPATAIASAPGRINVIGEHTDYNEGLALPAAVNRWVVAAVSPRGDDRVVVFSEAFGEAAQGGLVGPDGDAPGWSRLVLGLGRRFAELARIDRGFDVLIAGNVPPGAGVSSSGATAMAILNALRATFDVPVNDLGLVRLAQRVEHEDLGVATGLMDQYVSQFAHPASAMLIDFRGPSHDYVHWSLQEWCWVLIDTKIRRELAASAYGERVDETRRALQDVMAADTAVGSFADLRRRHIDALSDAVLRRRLRHYLIENERVGAAVAAMIAGAAESLGDLLLGSHESLRDDYAVSCAELDTLVESAIASDACAGARMMGGGFGGCTINLVRVDAVASFVDNVAREFESRFSYAPATGCYVLVGGARVHE